MALEVNLRVLDLAVGGDFVADEIGSAKTSKVFIRNVISGERVSAVVSKQGKNFRRAELLEVIEPSDARVTPRCPYFGVCGGCDLQHIEIDEQRQIKLHAVQNTFAKKLPAAGSCEVILYPGKLPSYSYRSRLKLHINTSGEVGFFQQGSRSLVAIKRCDVANEQVNTALAYLSSTDLELGSYFSRAYVDAYKQDVSCSFVLRSQSVSRNKASELLSVLQQTHPEVSWTLRSSRNVEHRYPKGYFFQANEEANTALQNLVLQNVSSDSVIDLYAGAGNISIPLAISGRDVIAVEINKELVQYGRKRADASELQGILKFVCNPAEQFIQNMDNGAKSASQTLVLDPPRSGALDVVRSLSAESFPEIIYVSCSLPCFIRDCSELISRGYELEKVTLVDMFPQTHHIELVAVLRSAAMKGR